ncbi:MAG TPA: ABC transporter substrate-binding protein [Acidimicrobiales bacterium]|nr:ABC transporter substrate-binding protein [Acidimicrobiales bacterium]
MVAALLTLAAACGGRSNSSSSSGSSGSTASSPGITDTEVKLGGSYPFSGPASAYGAIGKTLEGYFKYVNDQGGVKMGDGKTRKITFTTYDDAYTPANAVANAKRLVEQDQVFALFNTLGTANNTAIMDYANQQKVPQLYVATGAGTFGVNPTAHPFTTGWQLAYPTEAAIYGQYLKDSKPDAKVAVLYQNDDYGKDYLNAFKKAIQGTQIKIVSEQSYETTDPTVDSQVTNLAQTGADVFFNVTTPKFAAQAIKKAGELGWKPLQLLNSVSASITAVLKPAGFENAQNIVSATYIKDPTDPQWDNDAAMKKYKELLPKYASGVDPANSFGVYGFAVGETMVKALEATKKPTRDALMQAVRSMKGVEIGLLLPGVKVTMDGTKDGYPVESGQIVAFKTDRFVLQGKLIDTYEGKSGTLGA